MCQTIQIYDRSAIKDVSYHFICQPNPLQALDELKICFGVEPINQNIHYLK